jgi:hypothetical protein
LVIRGHSAARDVCNVFPEVRDIESVLKLVEEAAVGGFIDELQGRGVRFRGGSPVGKAGIMAGYDMLY